MKYILILALLVITGCARRPHNLTTTKNKIACYYESCKYEKEVRGVVDQALRYFKTHKRPAQSVVIFDVDDTLLSDYCSMKEVGFGYIPKLNHEWILKASAYAVPHIRDLYDYIITHGYRVIIVSGRKENEREATIKNLRDRGFEGFDRLILREPGEERTTALEYKSRRRKELVNEGAHIIACVGDQWSDLQGGNTGHQVKIPNYTYIIE